MGFDTRLRRCSPSGVSPLARRHLGVARRQYACRHGRRPAHLVHLAQLIPDARLLILPANHGSYLGELAASEADLSDLHLAVPHLTRFLDA